MFGIVWAMHQLVYVSAATHAFTKSELLELLNKARANNQRLGITGLLLFKDGDFIQLLEGDKSAVKALFDTISADPRHTGTIVLHEGETSHRLFNDWSMGFRDLSDPQVQATPGFSQFMNKPLHADAFKDDPNGCMDLLSLFKPSF